jgi:hypothetical protein
MRWFLKNKISSLGWFKLWFVIFVVLFPWQMRWIFYDYTLGGEIWEYGRLSIYGSMVCLLLASFFLLLNHKQEKHFYKNKLVYFIFIYSLAVGFFNTASLVYFYYLGLIYLAVLFAQLFKFLPKYFVFKVFLVSGLIESLLALQQFLTQTVIANKWLGLAEHLPATLGTSVVVVNGQRILRAYGSLSHPNMLGGFLFVVIFLGIYLWVDFYKRSQENNWTTSFSKKNLGEFIFIILALVVCTYGLLVTFSRSALLALLLSLGSALLISILKRDWLRVNIIVKYLLLFILVSWSFNIWLPGAWSGRWQAQGPLEEKSLRERVTNVSQLDFDSYKNIFFGQGLGLNTFDNYFKNTTQPVYNIQPIHNIFLLALAEVGFFGLILLGLVLRNIFRSAKEVDIFSTSLLLGLIFIGFFDHYLWTSWTGWLLITLSLANLQKFKN